MIFETYTPMPTQSKTKEELKIFHWRQERFEQMGFDRLNAFQLASRTDLAPEDFQRLLNKGCPLDQALAILW